MLIKKRIERIAKRNGVLDWTKSKEYTRGFVPRVQALRDLEGWYECEGQPIVSEALKPFYITYQAMQKAGKNVPSFFKWLEKFGLMNSIPQVDIKTMVKSMEPSKFKLSCRHRDILRCSDGQHFDSCYRMEGLKPHLPMEICQYLPQVGIIFITDVHGNIRARTWIIHCTPKICTRYSYVLKKYVTTSAGETGFLLVRPYGELPWLSIVRKLQEYTGADFFLNKERYPMYDNNVRYSDANVYISARRHVGLDVGLNTMLSVRRVERTQ